MRQSPGQRVDLRVKPGDDGRGIAGLPDRTWLTQLKPPTPRHPALKRPPFHSTGAGLSSMRIGYC